MIFELYFIRLVCKICQNTIILIRQMDTVEKLLKYTKNNTKILE